MNGQTNSALLQAQYRSRVVSVMDEVVTIEWVPTETSPGRFVKNEVVFIESSIFQVDQDANEPRPLLKAEVLRIQGNRADVQVFEDTSGLCIGDPVYQTGELLSVELGPGLLGTVYDGLQNPLHTLEGKFGKFLKRGAQADALDRKIKWPFTALVRVGDSVQGGDLIGTTSEGRFVHKIMAPFDLIGSYRVDWVQEGNFDVDTVIAHISDGQKTHKIRLHQRWPVRKPLPFNMLKQQTSERQYPDQPMVTTLRLIDTFFPIAKGGAACIPGPFGAGKTVLQNLISKYSDVDIVIIVACGERAGEVVESIEQFPRLEDPKTGGTLMDRTIIVCNTSSMPVASREASIYTGVTIGEYYRQMGYNVLLIADSTSRWAQAMRETSGRLEEIPGEEAFPAYLESSIKNLYERAGVIRNNEGNSGSLTLIGTVSPAGGNFEEPVTQGTLNTVKVFLGLSYDRAYKRFYPAVDPLISWSRYRDQLANWFAKNVGHQWNSQVDEISELLSQGNEIERMMQVTGEDGVTLEDYIIYQKSRLVDLVYLQQDAFDLVDASTDIPRQKEMFNLIYKICRGKPNVQQKDEVRQFYTKIANTIKDLNYTNRQSEAYSEQMSGFAAQFDQENSPGHIKLQERKV